MAHKTIRIKTSGESRAYEIRVGSGLIGSCGDWARLSLPPGTQKIALISNKKVFGLYGAAAKRSLEKAGFKTAVWLMQDGERHKNFRSLQQLLAFLSEQRFTRADAVVTLGGGVAGDLSGFAASVYLRGIPALQIPTTLVSQIDSSVGGKTAVNTEYGKNLVGTFYQPNGVLIDVATLETLPRRELTAGFCEAVKQGAIGGEKLFEQVKNFLEDFPVRKFGRFFTDNGDSDRNKFEGKLAELIGAQVSFKAEIVSGDQKEGLERYDSRSRKVLNFGHTIGHALEKVTAYKRLKHGEAVGYGMLAVAELSKKLDILDKNSLNLLSSVVHSAGELPKLDGIDADEVIRALAFDKKKAGKSITWILLKKIGEPVIIPDTEIPLSLIKRSIKTIL
jgi:3-dehydroquinate synthase